MDGKTFQWRALLLPECSAAMEFVGCLLICSYTIHVDGVRV
jgi:hypothetical protein